MDYDAIADQIIARQAERVDADRLRAISSPPEPPMLGPEPFEAATTLAGAFAQGVDAGIENLARCCGCGGDGGIVNPYDGSVIG